MAYQPKSYRKFLATSVTAAMVASVAAPVAGVSAATVNFTDIDNVKSWAGDAIEYLVDKGAIEGKGANKFDPYGQLTRAEAATILARALDLNVSDNAKTDFADAKDHWASKYIAAIQRQLPGVINGYNGKFNPNDNVTRQEMAKMVVEAYELEAVEGIDVNFPDNNGWGKEYVDILSSNGIIEGKPSGNFAPNANIQRAEAAVLFHRTEVEDERLIEELAVKNVDVLDAKTIQVTFNDGGSEQYTVDELKVGEQTEIEIEYKGETFKVVVTYDPNQVAAPGTVAFDNQPTAKALPQGSPLNEVYKFQVTAGEDEITLRSVQLKQHGTSRASDEDIENVHLSVNGEIRATGSINANGEVRLTRSINIPANSTVEFTVLADVNGDAQPTATAQFGIESIDAFTANAKLNGSFPHVGNSFNVVAGNIGTVTVTGQSTSSVEELEAGESQEKLGQFRLQADSVEGTKVKRVTIASNGINADDFENLYLYENSGKDKIQVEGKASRNEIVFDFSDSPIEIGRNQAKTFELKGDPLATGKGTFDIEETYHIVSEGTNSGYNNIVNINGGQEIGNIEVKAGDAKLRVSSKTPKAGDKIVASTSQYGVVREYNLISPGEDITLKDGKARIYWQGASADGVEEASLKDVVRSIEVYEANTGAVVKSYDIPAELENGAEIDLKGLNWFVESGKTIDLQVRAVAANEKVSLEGFDVTLGDISYDIHAATGSNNKGTIDGFTPSSQQWKEFTTTGDVEIQKPGSSDRISGYTISGGLSNAPLGNFRVEANEEDVKLTDATLTVTDQQGNINYLADLLANPTLVYDGEVIAHGDIKSNGEIEFDFDNDFIVETGSSNRKVLALQADVLETDKAEEAELEISVDKLETRGVDTNIVSDATPADSDANLLFDGHLDYGSTSVSIDVSSEAIDTDASSNAAILKFDVTNMAPNNSEGKAVAIGDITFENLFNFPEGVADNDFLFREDNLDQIGEYTSAVSGKTLTLTAEEAATIKGDDNEVFYLYGDLSKKDSEDNSIYKNVRMRLDLKEAVINPIDNDDVIRPLILNQGKGPDITIKD